jgi:putative redox protein
VALGEGFSGRGSPDTLGFSRRDGAVEVTMSEGEYKAEVIPEMEAKLAWGGDLKFTATTQRGYDLDFDAQVQWGCMPLEGLLMSLAGCMAIDVVAILVKMRCKPESFSMEIHGTRRPTPPQRITKVHLVLDLAGGPELTREKAEKAVALSQDKYCSVRHSLREDIEVTTEIRIAG